MERDNISQQAEEIEALKAIYLNEWTEDEDGRSFTMTISKTVKLFITLHPEYPSTKPPKYELMAPYLTAEEKKKLYKDFKTIYEDNLGGPILYQWIEKLKDYTIFHPKNYVIKKQVGEIPTQMNKTKDNLQRFSKKVVHGTTIEDRKSVFQGHVCTISNEADVRDFLEYLLENKKIAQAKHNIYAYRIAKKKTVLQDCDDDGEKHSSKRVLHLLQMLNLENVMVVVTRWYGGIQLGNDRFKHITNAAKRACVQAGFIQ